MVYLFFNLNLLTTKYSCLQILINVKLAIMNAVKIHSASILLEAMSVIASRDMEEIHVLVCR